MTYEISERKNVPGEWGVERIGGDGEIYMAIFSGPEAKKRAESYAKIEAENAELRGVLAWQDIESAPKDGNWFLTTWGGKTVLTMWLDNSDTVRPWAGFKVPSMMLHPPGQPTKWMPLPEPDKGQREVKDA